MRAAERAGEAGAAVGEPGAAPGRRRPAGVGRGEAAALLAITAAAAAIRWAGIRRGLWLDELTTCWVIRDAPADILPRSLLNNLSPLYYGLTWLSTRLVGDIEVGVRLPTYLAGVLVVPATHLVARRLTGLRAAALLAALIAAVDPALVDPALEARPYSLVQLFALLNIYLFSRFYETRTLVRAELLALNAALLFYLHYTTALFLGVDGLILILGWARGPRPTWKEVAVLALAAATFAVVTWPTAPQLGYLTANRDLLGEWIETITLEESLARFGLEHRVFLAASIAAVVGYATGGPRAQGPVGVGDARDVVMLVLWAAVPSAVAWALAEAEVVRINLDRYVIASSVACVLLPVVGVGRLCGGPTRAITFGSLALLAIAGVRGTVAGVRDQDEGRIAWRELVAGVNVAGPSDGPVFVRGGLAEGKLLRGRHDPLLRDYLLCTVNSAYRLRPDLLRRAEPIWDPEALKDRDIRGQFLFIGSSEDFGALERAAAVIERRQRSKCSMRLLVGKPPTGNLPIGLAVVVRFEAGRAP